MNFTKKNIIIYFILFGLIFGAINELDPTGGDISYSKMLNLPTLYALSIFDNIFNSIGKARFEKLEEQTGTNGLNSSLSRNEFEKLSPKEQEEFVSKMINQKDVAKSDPVIGERGSLYTFRGLFSFPILSALTWGFIGVVVYMIVLIKKKFSFKY